MHTDIIKEYNSNIVIKNSGKFENLTFDLRNLLPATLTYAGDEVFLKKALDDGDVSAVITSFQAFESFMQNAGDIQNKAILLSPDPRLDFFKFHNYLCHNTDFYAENKGLVVGNNCKISKLTAIASRNVTIGDNVVIEDFVKIYENVIIGDNSIIRSGCAIGVEGYQSIYEGACLIKVEHAGGVKIGKDVEIKNNCCIARHMFRDYTTIGDGSLLDNLSYFAHGAKCAKRCRIAANATILGSVIIGNDVWVGPASTITSAVTIGNHVNISIGSVVSQDLADHSHVTGNFAIDHDKFIKFIKQIR